MMTQYTLSLSYDDDYNMEEYEGEIKPGLILRLTFNRILTYHLTQVITSTPPSPRTTYHLFSSCLLPTSPSSCLPWAWWPGAASPLWSSSPSST